MSASQVLVSQKLTLLRELARRDIAARYRGSVMGIIWSLLIPLLQLAVYTFVFTSLFTPRGGLSAATSHYAVFLFSGLMLHAFLTECLTRAPSILLQHPNYIKKVVFPLALLPLVPLSTALFHLLMSAIILFGALAYLHLLSPMALLIPLAVAPLILLTIGLSWLLASLGLFLRDIGQVIGLIMMVLLFFSPIFTPVQQFPIWAQPYLMLNPLTIPIETVRHLLFDQQIPAPRIFTVYCVISCFVAAFGHAWFQRTRTHFADAF